jgi:hypothetical protein
MLRDAAQLRLLRSSITTSSRRACRLRRGTLVRGFSRRARCCASALGKEVTSRRNAETLTNRLRGPRPAGAARIKRRASRRSNTYGQRERFPAIHW